MKKNKNEKGITVIALVVTVVVMLIIAGVVIINIDSGADFKNYSKMCSDIELLHDKILIYYNRYGEFPIKGNEITLSVPLGIPRIATSIFYKIDLAKLGDLSLNYGNEDNSIGANDYYIIDIASSNICYMQGIYYDGNTNYLKQGVIIESNANVNVTEVSLSEQISVEVGKTTTLKAIISPYNAFNKKVIWASSNSEVAEIIGKSGISATIKGLEIGETTITVTTEDGSRTDTCSVTVVGPTVAVTGIFLNKSSLSLVVGESETLIATVTPNDASNQNVNWSSSDDSKATVNNGTITAISAGTATITATTEDRAYTATCEVTVSKAVTGVTLNKSSLSLVVGESETLIATVAPNDANNQNISWSSSNGKAIVENGRVTGVSGGTARITVTTEDGAHTATCTVTVLAAVTGITLSQNTTAVNVGGTYTISATVSPSTAGNKNVIWNSSDTSKATVNNGTITGVAAGEAIITATTAEGGYTANCTVIVVTGGTTVSKIVLSSNSISLNQTTTTRDLTVTMLPAEAVDKTFTYSLSGDDCVEVSASGSILTITRGTISGKTPIIRPTGTAMLTVTACNGLSKTCTITVTNTSGGGEIM